MDGVGREMGTRWKNARRCWEWKYWGGTADWVLQRRSTQSGGEVHGRSPTRKQEETEQRIGGQATQDPWGDTEGGCVCDGGHMALCVFQTS